MTVAEVIKTLHTNAAHSRAVAAGILQKVHDFVADGKLDQIKGCMQYACVTAKDVSEPPLYRTVTFGGSHASLRYEAELTYIGATSRVTQEARLYPTILRRVDT